MIYGFSTRGLTDNIIRPFVESNGGRFINSTGQVGRYEKTTWIDFDREQWIKDKTPIVIFGILRGTADLMRTAREHYIDYYYFDHAYFYRANDHRPNRTLRKRFYRITKNGQSLTKLINWKDFPECENRIKVQKRACGIKVHTEFFKDKGSKILLLPPSEFICTFYNYGTQEDWINKTIDKIKKYSDREIIIRKKGDSVDFTEQLKETFCTVSSQTTAVIDSIIYGIPSFCEEISCALPMSKTDLSEIENPYRPNKDEIENWVNGLLNAQFDELEIKSGYPLKMIENLQS